MYISSGRATKYSEVRCNHKFENHDLKAHRSVATLTTAVIASSTWLLTFPDLHYKNVITALIYRVHAIPLLRYPRNDILGCLFSMQPAQDIKYSGIKFGQSRLLLVEYQGQP